MKLRKLRHIILSSALIVSLMLSGCTQERTKATIGGSAPSVLSGAASQGSFANTNASSDTSATGTPNNDSGAFPRTNTTTSYPGVAPLTPTSSPPAIGNLLKAGVIVGGAALALVTTIAIVNKIKQKADFAREQREVTRLEKLADKGYQPGWLEKLYAAQQARERAKILSELKKELNTDPNNAGDKDTDQRKGKEKNSDETPAAASLKDRLAELGKKLNNLSAGREQSDEVALATERKAKQDALDREKAKQANLTDQPSPLPACGPGLPSDKLATDLGAVLGNPDPAIPTPNDAKDTEKETGAALTDKDKNQALKDAKKQGGKEKPTPNDTDKPQAPGQVADAAKGKKVPEQKDSTGTPGTTTPPANADKNAANGKQVASDGSPNGKPVDQTGKPATPKAERDLQSPALFENGKLKDADYARRVQAFVMKGVMRGQSLPQLRSAIASSMNTDRYGALYDSSGRTTDFNWRYSESTLSQARAEMNRLNAPYSSKTKSGWAAPAATNTTGIMEQALMDRGSTIATRTVRDLGTGKFRVTLFDTKGNPVGDSFILDAKPVGY